MSSELGRMNTVDWDKLQDYADRYERACKANQSIELREFLPPPGDAVRMRCLQELIKVDLEICWRRGQPTVLEFYLEKFSELGSARDLPPALIYEEYIVRQRHGDKPSLAVYRQRFPDQFEALTRLAAQQDVPTSKPPTAPTASTSAPQSGALVLGKNMVLSMAGGYKLMERIGIGGFGEVWKAQAPGGVLAAIKIIFRPLDHDSARHEMDALELIKGLRHHFLLKTIAFWPQEDRLLIAMDLADGSLRDRLKQCLKEGKQGVPLDELLLYARETAEALDYLHDKQVLHRDIKPENLLLSEGHIRVADFGLARVHQNTRLATASGSGTPMYMAPEVWREKINRHSDQYSLAVTYVELRLGRRLYSNVNMYALMAAHLEQKPDLEPMPEAEQQVVLKALAKDPLQRYPSCREFVNALEAAIHGETRTDAANPTALASQSPPMAAPSWSADTDWNTIKPGQSAPPIRPGLPLADTHPEVPSPKWHSPVGSGSRTPWVLLLLVIAGAAGWILWPRNEPTGPGPGPTPVVPENKWSALPLPSAGGKYQAVEGAGIRLINGKEYPKAIDCVLDVGGTVRFLLVHSDQKPHLEPFYIMEDKVTNTLFSQFAQSQPDEVHEQHWRLGGRARHKAPAWGEPQIWASLDHLPLSVPRLAYAYLEALNSGDALQYLPHGDDVGIQNGRLPVLRVEIEDAHRFARWLGGLLPSEEEWDVAAGRWERNRGPGPYDEVKWDEGDFAVRRVDKGPMPVGAATKDRSFFGCHDMAGNGLEWTRTFIFNVRDYGEMLNLSRIPPDAYFVLRGYSYKGNRPLSFEMDLPKARPSPQPYDRSSTDWRPSFDIGFRVIVRPAPWKG